MALSIRLRLLQVVDHALPLWPGHFVPLQCPLSASTMLQTYVLCIIFGLRLCPLLLLLVLSCPSLRSVAFHSSKKLSLATDRVLSIPTTPPHSPGVRPGPCPLKADWAADRHGSRDRWDVHAFESSPVSDSGDSSPTF